jgi:predicted nucleotidyltransferase
LIRKLKGKIEDLIRAIPLLSVVLFGSYARGNSTVASDIDILVVYSGKKRKDAFKTVKKILDIPLLEPHVYSEDEYKELRDTISQMISGGVVLFSASSNSSIKK